MLRDTSDLRLTRTGPPVKHGPFSSPAVVLWEFPVSTVPCTISITRPAHEPGRLSSLLPLANLPSSAPALEPSRGRCWILRLQNFYCAIQVSIPKFELVCYQLSPVLQPSLSTRPNQTQYIQLGWVARVKKLPHRSNERSGHLFAFHTVHTGSRVMTTRPPPLRTTSHP